ncbi:hypothetical protein HOLleu_01240 [Holothuria leucospilota]|uniref:Uncharacterized protein n=1 Tax=Holothuria leucospilota TaxID=206669 RepID=A0A9Q1CP30_HOLLE|nr:hypothetical protein HOLleu_01240 [Holothuria leucospilota]
MEDTHTFPVVPDELCNAGWRVHYDVEDDKQYFVNKQTKMRSDTLPTVVKCPSTNLTLFENANIDLTESFFSPFTLKQRSPKKKILQQHLDRHRTRKSPVRKGQPRANYQKLMEDSTTRFPLGDCSGEIKISNTAREMLAYIFASMMDRVACGYLKQNCEGCDMGWPSQMDHRCLNFGSNVPVTDMHFNDLQHLVKDEWVIDAVRDYLVKSVEVDTIRVVMKQLRTSWSRSPELTVEALETSRISAIIKGHLEDEFIPRRMGTIDYSSVELNYTL